MNEMKMKIMLAVGGHTWEDAGMPGLSKCECGIYRRYDKYKQDYEYSVEESNG